MRSWRVRGAGDQSFINNEDPRSPAAESCRQCAWGLTRTEQGTLNCLNAGLAGSGWRALALSAGALVAVPVLIEIAWLVARVLVVLTRHFLLTGFVAVTVLVKIPWGVAGVFVMRAGLFLWHGGVPFAALIDSNFLEGAQFLGHLLANTKAQPVLLDGLRRQMLFPVVLDALPKQLGLAYARGTCHRARSIR